MNARESTTEERKWLDDKLVDFNRASVPFRQDDGWIDLSHVVEDGEGRVIAGANATLYCWNVMYVDVLFVDITHRGRGLGRSLMEVVESKAKRLGGYMAHLDTFDWQAREFYQRLGYVTFGVLNDCPPGHDRYYMTKRF